MTTKIEIDKNTSVNLPNEKKVKNKQKDKFTVFQSIILIVLTLAVSIGGGYAIGKKYFWNGLDMQRVSTQLEYFKQKVASEPENTENRVNLGYTYFLKGDNDNAITELKQALAISEKNGVKNFDAYYNLGLVYGEEERYDDALEMFEKARVISPKDYKTYLQKGIIYRKLKMYNEALDILQKTNKLMPSNSDIIYQIGLVAEEQGNYQLAREIYKDALSYDPLFKDAVDALERIKNK